MGERDESDGLVRGVVALIRIALAAVAIARTAGEARQAESDDGWFIVLSIALHLCALGGLLFGLASSPLGFGVAAIAMVFAYPWFLATRTFVPLGMWRTSFALGWMARVIGGGKGHGGLILASWALHRMREPSPRGLDFVSRRIQIASFSNSVVLASGLLASARSDRDGALTTLESLELLKPSSATPHRLALEYLLADAAQKGHWARVIDLGRRWPTHSRAATFLVAIAVYLLKRAEPPSRRKLWWLWAIAPRRRQTLPLLRRALGESDGESDVDAPESSSTGEETGNTSTTSNTADKPEHNWPAPRTLSVPDSPSSLGRALAIHLALQKRGTGTVELEELVVLARAWDVALDDGELETMAYSRAAELESRAPDRVSGEFQSAISRQLATIVRDSAHRLDRLPTDSPVLCRASTLIREEMLENVELGFTALEERTETAAELPAIDEWREFLALRKLHSELAQTGGLAVRRLVFPHVNHAACNHAVWLWNIRKEYLLANAMFHWLLEEATAVGDARAIELQKKNCDIT